MTSRPLRIFTSALAAFSAMTCAFAGSGPTLLQRTSQLIASPDVALDLKLSQTQIASRDKAFADYQATYGALAQRALDGPEAERDVRRAEIDKLLLNLESRLVSLLTPAQENRLKQIGIQQEGTVAMLDEVVAKDLGLNPNQRVKIRGTLENVQRAQDDYQAAVGEEIAKIPEPRAGDAASVASYDRKVKLTIETLKPREKEFLAAKNAGNKQIMAVLTAQQRAKWTAMHGKLLPIEKGL